MMLAQVGLEGVGGAVEGLYCWGILFSLLPLTAVLIVEGCLAMNAWIRDEQGLYRNLRHIETDDDLWGK